VGSASADPTLADNSAALYGAQGAEQLLCQLGADGFLETDLRRRPATLWAAEREAVPKEVEVPLAGTGVRWRLFDG
jgi:hypothetical protein